MKIAIPVAGGKLSPHFGHCPMVALVEVDLTAKSILSERIIPAPPHEPGRFPVWLRQQGADVVIAGGMGQRALQLFAKNGIQVILGAPSEPPEILVLAWLEGRLRTGENVCHHGPGEAHTCDKLS